MSQAIAKNTFPAMLEKYGAEIARALPKHMSGDRLARIALTEFRKAPKLANCDPRSVFAAVIMASQLGLEPGINGQSYLIPYGAECQFVPGWKGLVDLVNRTGRATAWTGAVFEGDEFEWELGDRPFVRHRPCGEDAPEKMTHVYAVGRINGIEVPIIEVWRIEKVWRHRDRYNKVGQKHYSYRHPEMYARKVPLMQVLKYLPSSIELNTALEMNYAADRGTQRLVDPLTVIDGTYAPPVYEEEPAEVEAPANNGSATAALKDRLQQAAPADMNPATGEVSDPLADLLMLVNEAADEEELTAIWPEIEKLGGERRKRAEAALKARKDVLGAKK
jgi:recombination protein RecT